MRKLILGCGYLGMRVARLWRGQGAQVEAVTRSAERARTLENEGLIPITGDVLSPASLPRLDPYETVLYAIGYDRRSGTSMRDVYVQGLRNTLQASGGLPGRFIYISSTGVYGDVGGDWIDESTPCRPSREGGKICLEAEQELAAHPLFARSIVLRVAGLYGPGRLPRKQELIAGETIAAPQAGALNLIHVEDAASVVLAAEQQAPLPSLYLVSDGTPVERGEYFRALADLLNAPPPRFQEPAPQMPAAQRALADKRIDNTKMLRELGVTLQYPNYRAGLAAIVAAEQPRPGFGSAK